MEPGFRTQYEPCGRSLKLRGAPVDAMSREELIAVIGFLFEKISLTEPAGALTQVRELDWEYPSSNEGLFEG